MCRFAPLDEVRMSDCVLPCYTTDIFAKASNAVVGWQLHVHVHVHVHVMCTSVFSCAICYVAIILYEAVECN